MTSEAKPKKNKKLRYDRPCPRHHDLNILIHSAKKQICNGCFATLKKSYFNVIAGLLLEQHYLHNVAHGLVEQDNRIMKQLQEIKGAVLNLQAEITEIKNNGRHREKSRPRPAQTAQDSQEQMEVHQPPQSAQTIHSIGHVAKVAHSLQDLLHVQIARVLQSWKRKKATTHPKSDDLQDRSTTTHAPPGKLIK